MLTMSEIKTCKTSRLVEVYNHLTGKQIKKFQDRATAEKKTTEAVKEHAAHMLPAISTLRKPGQPVRTGLPGPNSKFTGKKIHLLTKENPRREGTAGHASFALMREGMSYEDYRLRGGRSNDLAWDVAHGYVEMV